MTIYFFFDVLSSISNVILFSFEVYFINIQNFIYVFFSVYFLIQISFTELWEGLCNKDIKQLMDEAEHDIKNYAGREVFYLAKAESDKCFFGHSKYFQL